MVTIFTKIINKEIPSYIIYEDKFVISFLDINPLTKGHVLVATKEEYSSIFEVPDFILMHMFVIIKKISKILIKTFNAKGLNLINNNGKVAGQTIFHYHVHLIPRFHNKEVNFSFNNHNYKLKENDYKIIQQNILKNLNL
ncbi:HIT domain protein [Candidatus Phytoplasma oryzae]|uniref:Diadenosine tetraphosphate hydrolase n=1 Tax=Candidatus Phytoplasma oryzae TaxID=203274 RepID=A0A139JQG1_9MOLU|nr:HIT domain-containing protein [Candidatus Phytoplasma oryzae]KXT29100.1 HIT domain protein [Candidatus Phytoplasma oryzae]KXT29155.1 HIT domain protein [Candidatus Phytoplasma oryzae]RAM57916.1 diadenosine tetraphosphate hydrolase [Candidatus Phytoplasma oryzae]